MKAENKMAFITRMAVIKNISLVGQIIIGLIIGTLAGVYLPQARIFGLFGKTFIGALKAVDEIERVGFKTTLSKGHFGVHELTKEVMQGMEDWISLAPLHNRAYLDAVAVMQSVLPDARFIGVFETAFHRDIPLERKIFGVPFEWYEQYGAVHIGTWKFEFFPFTCGYMKIDLQGGKNG